MYFISSSSINRKYVLLAIVNGYVIKQWYALYVLLFSYKVWYREKQSVWFNLVTVWMMKITHIPYRIISYHIISYHITYHITAYIYIHIYICVTRPQWVNGIIGWGNCIFSWFHLCHGMDAVDRPPSNKGVVSFANFKDEAGQWLP